MWLRPNQAVLSKKQLHKQIKSNYNMNVNEMKSTHDYKYAIQNNNS